MNPSPESTPAGHAEFLIDASSSTFEKLISETTGDRPVHYKIPVYQRPYSWGEAEVDRFLLEILESFSSGRQIFIGTMQLSVSDKGKDGDCTAREVVDGQQRLITLCLILKNLDLLLAELGHGNGAHRGFDWISSKVNRGSEQNSLRSALGDETIPGDMGLSRRYSENSARINQMLKSAFQRREGDSLEIRDFARNFAQRIQFVSIVVENASLSQTIHIFNTINSTGLDLNTGDLFKVRAYDYLTKVRGRSDECIEQIDEIYYKLSRRRDLHEGRGPDIMEILGMYQKILVARHSGPYELMHKSCEAFYEELFDALINKRIGPKLTKIVDADNEDRLVLDLAEIDALVDFRLEFEDIWMQAGQESSKAVLAFHLIDWGRYSCYWNWPLVAAFAFRKEVSFTDAVFVDLCLQFAKTLVVYSVIKAKQIYSVHKLSAELLVPFHSLDRGSVEAAEVFSACIKKLQESVAGLERDFEKMVSCCLADSQIGKHLVCRLVEYLAWPDNPPLGRIFRTGYDIEHIRSCGDGSFMSQGGIPEEWRELLHGLGNLMLLDASHNRSIKAEVFKRKQDAYLQSIGCCPDSDGPGSNHLKVAYRIGNPAELREWASKGLANRPNSQWNPSDEISEWSTDLAELKLREDRDALIGFLFSDGSGSET